jgi:hypothetical protein
VTKVGRDRLRRCVVASGLILYAGSLGVWFVVPAGYRPEQPLDPFLTVLTDLDHAVAADALRRAGALEVITPDTTYVHVSRFRFVERVPLPHALRTLDPLDPRRDPWIERLGEYFRFDGWNAVYARFDLSLYEADRVVRHALGGAGRVAEWSGMHTVAALAVFAVAAIAVIIAFGRGRLRIVPALLPWIPAVAAVGLKAAAPAGVLAIFVGWVAAESIRVWRLRPHCRSVNTETLWIRGVGLAAATSGTAVFVQHAAGFAALVPLLVALAGSVAGTAAVVGLTPRDRDADHRPFLPLSILSARLPTVIGRSWFLLSLALLPILLVTPLLLDAAMPGSGVRPVPDSIADGRAFGFDSLHEIWLDRRDDALPDLSAYLAHRAYQQGFVYGRAFGFPARDEQVSIARYREETDGLYSEYHETMIAFDDPWIEHVLSDVPAGITSMLVGIGYPAGVVLGYGDAIYSGHSRIVQHFTYVVLVFVPFLLRAFPRAKPMRARSSLYELSRRRRQVA